LAKPFLRNSSVNTFSSKKFKNISLNKHERKLFVCLLFTLFVTKRCANFQTHKLLKKKGTFIKFIKAFDHNLRFIFSLKMFLKKPKAKSLSSFPPFIHPNLFSQQTILFFFVHSSQSFVLHFRCYSKHCFCHTNSNLSRLRDPPGKGL